MERLYGEVKTLKVKLIDIHTVVSLHSYNNSGEKETQYTKNYSQQSKQL